MMSLKSKSLLLLSFVFTYTNASAQDEENFPRIARRGIDAYTKTLKGTAYDSTAWHGGMYAATSSRGRIMPNAFLNYKKGKWNIKGDVELDLSDYDTKREEDGNYSNANHEFTRTSLSNKIEHEDLTMRFDYSVTRKDVLSLDIFQKFYHDRINESSILSGIDGDGEELASKYEEQTKRVKDFNCGVLFEHLHKFAKGGSLSSRVYFKYDNKPTDLSSSVWGTQLPSTLNNEHQLYESADPKAQIIYLSPVWKGFSFGVRQKIGFMNMRIDDTASKFNYNVDQSLSSFSLDYNPGPVSLSFQAGYEIYHHDINDHINDEVSHTYHDWMYHAIAQWNVNRHHRVRFAYDQDITRPTYTQLYPFVHIGSSISSWVVGNSALQPSTSRQIQGRYTFTCTPLTLNGIVTYKTVDDDISGISTYDEAAGRSFKTWINDGKYSTIKFALEGDMTFGMFNMTMGVHAQRIQYGGERISGDKSWSHSVKMRPQLKLPSQWTLAYVFLYNGPEMHRHYYNRSYTYMALRAQKQIGNWAIYALAQDLLRSDHTKVLRSQGNTIVTNNDYNARALIMGCSYVF